MPHRDDRDAARSRIEALERQLAEAEAEREEAEAELARAEAGRRELERRLASGEPPVARPPPQPAWSRDEFAKRIAALSPTEDPRPQPRSPPPPRLSRPALSATRGPGRPEVSAGPASRTRARLAVAASTLLVHALVASLVSLPRVAGSARVVTTVMVAFVCAQSVLNAAVLAGLRARYPVRAAFGSLLTTVFSAFVLMLGGGPGFPGDPAGLGLYLGASVVLASYVVGGVATRPDDGRPGARSAGQSADEP